MSKKSIITISREFGSGGRTIGQKLAENLGIPFYDKELILKVAEKTGFSPEFIEENGEYTKSRWSFLATPNAIQAPMGGLNTADYLWVTQHQTILDLVEKGPCVIVGRCADYILRERTDCIHAFIHADEEFKINRVVNIYNECDQKNPLKCLKEKDEKRRINYEHYTDREWGAYKNYTLALNSSDIGIDKCVDILAQLYK